MYTRTRTVWFECKLECQKKKWSEWNAHWNAKISLLYLHLHFGCKYWWKCISFCFHLIAMSYEQRASITVISSHIQMKTKWLLLLLLFSFGQIDIRHINSMSKAFNLASDAIEMGFVSLLFFDDIYCHSMQLNCFVRYQWTNRWNKIRMNKKKMK